MSIREEMEQAFALAKEKEAGPYRWRMSDEAMRKLATECGPLVPNPGEAEKRFLGLPVMAVAGAGIFWQLDVFGYGGYRGHGLS